MQITFKVMLPEALPSLINGFTTAFITILGYGAMSAAIGGGGLGSLAINNGYQRRMYLVLYVSVILLVIMVQIFQSLGTHTANRLDRRNTKTRKRGKRGAGSGKSQRRNLIFVKSGQGLPLAHSFSGQKLPLTPVAFCGKFNANESKIMIQRQ